MDRINKKLLRTSLDTISGEVGRIKELATEEENKFFDLPENFQYSERGSRLEEIAETLNTECDKINDAVDAIEFCVWPPKDL